VAFPLRPIQYEPGATGGADQPDSISHVRDIVAWRDVGAIETSLTSRANRVGPADESGADTFDFIGFDLLVHVNKVSRVGF